MLTLLGPDALSPARAARLRSAAQAIDPGVEGVAARFAHLVDTTARLAPPDLDKLGTLLEYGTPSVREGAPTCVVGPRPGTLTPWASKATDIARVCGLSAVRRVERVTVFWVTGSDGASRMLESVGPLLPLLHDRMIEAVFPNLESAAVLFARQPPRALRVIPILRDGRAALVEANSALGLALTDDEVTYLANRFSALRRDPTDVEVMMFAQANSEHCRHKIFNAAWTIDGEACARSLFAMIRHTHACHGEGVLSAYKDNAAVIAGSSGDRLFARSDDGLYVTVREDIDILMKVETHNHPTGIAPFAGAATGAGGEIRDEGATGRGAKPKAGLCGFTVSNLRIPGFEQPWEADHGRSPTMATPLEIMIDGPIGAASFNNEFGRPNLCGTFRTFEQTVDGAGGPEVRGFHKPIMIAGGIGNIRRPHVSKLPVASGAPLVVLGGPALLIGLGGGAASSMSTADANLELDFASVQRSNPEMQRRCQEVIDRCWALGDDNPIASIHDVGAGGLSNAIPEIVHDAGRGAALELATIPSDDPAMSPMELWCNEAQERYVLALRPEGLDAFRAIAERERAPFAVVGAASGHPHIRMISAGGGSMPIDVPMDVIFGLAPKMHRDTRRTTSWRDRVRTALPLDEAALRVLRLPSVASKMFLISIGDRSVTGMVARDQLVGPWQIPVADVAVTTTAIGASTGEAMAMGERPQAALIDPPAAARVAVGEALTNLAAAFVAGLERVRLSANWMHPAGHPGADAGLYDMVAAIGLDLCPKLGIAIPVGKDSMSMKATWADENTRRAVTAPTSLVISAFAPVADVAKTVTPQLRTDRGPTDLILIDLGLGRARLGASAFAQVTSQLGDQTPDVDNPAALKAFFNTIQVLLEQDILLAYHDRSDGGLLVTLAEMAFAGHVGLTVSLDGLGHDLVSVLFNEELGAVLQVRAVDTPRVLTSFAAAGLGPATHVLGTTNDCDELIFVSRFTTVLRARREEWERIWNETSYEIAKRRDDRACVDEWFEDVGTDRAPRVTPVLTFDPGARPAVVAGVARPAVAILREQGVNGQLEMAAAFLRAGFDAVDVHMSDILSGRIDLARFRGLAACGGFSYGDVLGAGEGWAKSVLFHDLARAAFARFFARPDTFALGVCNGCQMMSGLRAVIPGADHWPRFVRNRSDQFEARFAQVRVEASPSVLLSGMEGSRIPIAVAHGEGRPELRGAPVVALRWADARGDIAHRYPANPNGAPEGIAGVTTSDGRVTIMMPHPERVFLTAQNSWHPDEWGVDGPWMRMFRNARAWVG